MALISPMVPTWTTSSIGSLRLRNLAAAYRDQRQVDLDQRRAHPPVLRGARLQPRQLVEQHLGERAGVRRPAAAGGLRRGNRDVRGVGVLGGHRSRGGGVVGGRFRGVRVGAEAGAPYRPTTTHTTPRRSTEIFDGSGTVTVGDKTWSVSRGDLFVVPSWQPFSARSQAGATDSDRQALDLFRFSDAPVFEALKLSRVSREDPAQ